MTSLNSPSNHDGRPRRAHIDGGQKSDSHPVPHDHHPSRKLRLERRDLEVPRWQRVLNTAAYIALTSFAAYSTLNSGEAKAPQPETVVTSTVDKPEFTPKVIQMASHNPNRSFTEDSEMQEKFENLSESEQSCPVVELPFEVGYDYQEALQGSQTEFALSTERFKKIEAKLNKAGSREQANEIVEELLRDMGITPMFNEQLLDEFDPVGEPSNEKSEVSAYRTGMVNHLRGLTLMPEEMAQEIEIINFVTDATMTKDAKDKRGNLIRDKEGKIKKEHVQGYIVNGTGEMNLAVPYAETNVIVHEAAHLLHQKACKKFTDAEMRAAFDEAMDLLKEYPELKREQVGIPTEYSETGYAETFAELTAQLVNNGELFESDNDSESALRLRKLVIERLKKAMPDTDVEAWLQYMSLYKEHHPDVISPQDVLDKQISPLDFAFVKFRDVEGADLKKAVELQMGNASTYLYAAHLNDGEVVLNYYTTSQLTDRTVDDMKAAAIEYAQPFAEKASRELDVIDNGANGVGVRHFEIRFKPLPSEVEDPELTAMGVGVGGASE